jgi:hypothetical protein
MLKKHRKTAGQKWYSLYNVIQVFCVMVGNRLWSVDCGFLIILLV